MRKQIQEQQKIMYDLDQNLSHISEKNESDSQSRMNIVNSIRSINN